MTTTPAATFTAAGFCHNMPVEGTPHAGRVSERDGIPSVPVSLGTVAGREVTISISTLDEVRAMESALVDAEVYLSMWLEDHRGRAA